MVCCLICLFTHDISKCEEESELRVDNSIIDLIWKRLMISDDGFEVLLFLWENNMS